MIAENAIIVGRELSQTLNGQGSCTYDAGWNVTRNDPNTEPLVAVCNGWMNPSEGSVMFSYACPPCEDNPYLDNHTHMVGAESVFASNYDDPFVGGYAPHGGSYEEILIRLVKTVRESPRRCGKPVQLGDISRI